MILGDTVNAIGPMTGGSEAMNDLPAVRATLDDLFRRAVMARPDALALLDPPELDAVTVTRIVEPTSPETSVYAWPVAPTMSAQLPPLASQRRHW